MRVTTLRSDGCLGFVLAANGEAAMVDPTRATAKVHEHLAREGAKLRFVIDTHTHADHLSGARKLCDETGAVRDARIVAVCKSGKRSGWATMFLRVAGFTDVRSLDGGMLAWSAAGLPADAHSM